MSLSTLPPNAWSRLLDFLLQPRYFTREGVRYRFESHESLAADSLIALPHLFDRFRALSV